MKIDWGNMIGMAIAVLLALAIWKLLGADTFVPSLVKKGG